MSGAALKPPSFSRATTCPTTLAACSGTADRASFSQEPVSAPVQGWVVRVRVRVRVSVSVYRVRVRARMRVRLKG